MATDIAGPHVDEFPRQHRLGNYGSAVLLCTRKAGGKNNREKKKSGSHHVGIEHTTHSGGEQKRK
jgi:hypothetical protein